MQKAFLPSLNLEIPSPNTHLLKHNPPKAKIGEIDVNKEPILPRGFHKIVEPRKNSSMFLTISLLFLPSIAS